MASLPDPSTAAFVIVDMQNDFIHPDGAYGRAGKTVASIAALPARHAKLATAMRAAGGWIVSTHFTLVPGRDGEPFISPHLKRMRPVRLLWRRWRRCRYCRACRSGFE